MRPDLILSADDRSKCQRAGLHDAASIIRQPKAELGRWLSDEAVIRVRQAAAVAHAPRMASALQRWHECKVNGGDTLTTGDQKIDDVFGGGVHLGSLSEVVGQSAAGKTQLALQTAVYAALALDKDADVRHGDLDENKDDLFVALQGQGIRSASERRCVMYIVFDGKGELDLVTRRMRQICRALMEVRWRKADIHRRMAAEKERERKRKRTTGAFAASENERLSLPDLIALAQQRMMANIHLAAINDYGMLQHLLQYDVSALLADTGRSPFGLIVLDDVTDCIHAAAESRASHPSQLTVERSRVCAELSDALKKLAAAKENGGRLAVLVTNHVVDVLDQHKHVLRSAVEGLLDGAPQVRPSPPKTSQVIFSSGIDGDVTLTAQEPRYTGMTAHLHSETIREMAVNAPPYMTRAQLLENVMSTLRSASLGLSWVNCINVRIVLVHTRREIVLPRHHHKRLRDAGMRGNHRFGVRRAVSVKNPFAPTQSATEYIISADGIRSLAQLGLKAEQATPNEQVATEDDLLWHSVGDASLAADENKWLSHLESSQPIESV